MFILVVKERSAWGFRALRRLPCTNSRSVSRGRSLEVLLTISSGIWDPEEKPDLLSCGHWSTWHPSVQDLELNRTGGI